MIVLPIYPDLREKFAYLRLRADVLRCCGIVDNLRIIEHDNKNLRAVCIKCYRKHRILMCEPEPVRIADERERKREVLLKRGYNLRAEPGAVGVKRNGG